MSTRVPNILLVHSDQHRYDCTGVTGHALVKTPAMDRLAREGTLCTHAFTPNPVCSPARACLQTGAWSSQHGCGTIVGVETYRPARPEFPVLTQLLADAGYRVAHVGKFHGEVAGGPTDHGAEAFVGTSQYNQWRQEQGIPPRPRERKWFGEVDPHVTVEQSALAWQCDRTLEFLNDFASTPDRPFFLRWDPPEPHLPNVVPEEAADWYPPETIDPWPSFPDALDNKPAIQRRTRERWGVDGFTWTDWQPIVSRYLAEITMLDRQLGRLLDRLDELGIADDTLVVYTTDHGDFCGGHGMIDKHFCMYDDILRVPLILRWPGSVAPGARFDGFITHEIDLARTFLAAADVDAPETFVGADLVRDFTSGNQRDDMLSQYQGTHQGLYTERALRTHTHKYVYNPVSFDELYDLRADPGEIHNLIDDPAQAEALRDCQERMTRWMKSIGDPQSGPLWTWS